MTTRIQSSIAALAPFALCLALAWSSPAPTHAADFYWDTDGSVLTNNIDGTGLGGTGNWDLLTANWWDLTNLVVWPNGPDRAFFTYAYAPGLPTYNTVTLSTGVTADELLFLRSGYTLTGGDLTLTGPTPTLFAAMGTFATINSQILGTNGLTMTGGGSIRLSNNANSYTGTTTLANGSIIITNQSALGADTSAIVVTGHHSAPGSTQQYSVGGGSLVLDGTGGNITISRDLSLQGTGPIAANGAALISSGVNTLSGIVTMGEAYSGTYQSTRILAADGTLNITNTLNVLGTAATTISTLGGINQAGASFYNVSGVLAGTGTLGSSGGGTLFLNPSDASGFSGTIRVGGSAASGQSTVRIDSPNVLGTRTASGTSSVLDLYGGVLTVLMDTPSVLSGGAPAHVYGRDSSTFFADHTPNSSVKDQTVTFGSFTFEDNETFTFNSRNGYGMSFTTASVNGGNEYTTFNNNLQGGALLSFTGNFWSNTDNGAARTFTIGGNGDTRINGNIMASSTTYNHNLSKTGSGTLTITGTGSTIDGNINAYGGTLAINDFRALNMHAAGSNAGQLNIGSSSTTGTLAFVGNNLSLANLTTNTPVNLAGTTGGATILANQTGTSPGVVFNGNFGASGAGDKTLTLGGTNTGANTINGVIADNGGANNTFINKLDPGTWVLAGTNTYTGNTRISNGILRIKANAPTSTIIADGTLGSTIEFYTTNVYAGGTLEFLGQPSVNNVETLNALDPNYGAGTIKLTPGSGGTASLIFASLASVGGGATVNIVAPTSLDTVSFTTAPATANIANAALFYNGADFAFVPGAGLALRAPIYGGDADFATSATALVAGQSNEVTGSFTTPGALAIDSLKIDGDHTLTLGGNLTIRTAAGSTASGGLIQTGGSGIVTGGFSIGTNNAAPLVINVDGGANTLEIQSALFGTGGFTKSGEGTLRLAGANAQTGTITINEGTVRLVGTGQLGGVADLTLRQNGVLELNGVTPAAATNAFNNNGIVRNTGATDLTLTVGGTGSTGTGTSYGIIEDGGPGRINLVKTGTGAQSWLGLSTYTGTTTIGGTGIVSINNLQDGGLPSGIGASGSAASNLVFNGTSTTQAYGGLSYVGPTNDNTDRLFTFDGGANGGARILSSGVNYATSSWTNTGALAFGPNAAGNPQGLVLGGTSTGDNRFFPQIGDNGAAATSLYKTDAGLWHLEATNTYTGPTTIRGGALAALDGTSLPTASNLVLDGGSLASTGLFSRSLGTGAGQVQWTAYGSGGFSAGGSPLTVNFGSGHVWGSTTGFLGAGQLLLNASGVAKSDVDVTSSFQITQGTNSAFNATTTAGSTTVTLTSGTTAGLTAGQAISGNANIPAGYYISAITGATTFTLNSGTGVTAATGVATNASGVGYRQINVSDFGSSGADFATISGVISGAGNLAKEGAGILNLRGANTYTGQTMVRGGTLVVESLGSSGTAGATSVGEQLNANTDASAVTLGNGATTGGILQYVGLGETSDRKIRLNTTTGSNQIHADGVGPLILTNVANEMVDGNKLLYLRGTNASGNMITSVLADTEDLGGGRTGKLGLYIDGSATWILTGNNTYSGFTTTSTYGTTLSGGALGLGHDNALGNSILILSYGELFAYGADRTLANVPRMSSGATTGFQGDYSITFSSPLDLAITTSGTTTMVNSIVAGETLTFGGATANVITANRSWVIDGSGTTIFTGNITTSTTFGLNTYKYGDGVLELRGNTGSNWTQNNANIDIDRGTLRLGASGVIPDGAGFGNVILSPELANVDTATLDLNGQTETINGLTANSDGIAVIDNTSASAATLIFGANDQPVSFGGGIGTYTITDSGAGALSIVKAPTASTATSVTIPTGVTLTYSGTTGVQGGTFTIASPVNGTTALEVRNTGSKLRLTGGITSPGAISSILVEDGATLSLLDGAGNKISNLTSLQLGSTGGTMSSLNLNVGDDTTPGDEVHTDLLTLLTGGTLTLYSGNQVTFNLTDAGLNANQTYDLLSFVDGGLTTGVLGTGDWLLGATPGGFSSMTLSVTDTLIQLQTGNLVSGTFYWRGLTDNTWNGNFNNWSTDKAGTTPAGTLPGQAIDVVFAYDGASGALVTTLEQNFRVNSLTFESGASTPSSVTIDPGTADPNSRIEVAPSASTDGIEITAGGPAAVTISGAVKLGANQTWGVADAGSVLSIGELRGEADVTKTGSGKVILSAAADPTFNAGVTSDFTISGGTLELQNAAALGNTINANLATVSVGTGGAFYYNGAAGTVANPLTLAGGTLSAGTDSQIYSGTVAISADSFVNLRNNNGDTSELQERTISLSGVLSGTGDLTVDSDVTLSSGNPISGALVVTNPGNSGWTGDLNIHQGSVYARSGNADALGSGAINFEGGKVEWEGAGGDTYSLNRAVTVASATGNAVAEWNVDRTSGTSVFTVNSAGTLTLGGTGGTGELRVLLQDGTNSAANFTGPVTLANDAAIHVRDSATAALATFSNVISESGGARSLIVNGPAGGGTAWGGTAGILRLTGANTFTGNVTVNAGTLEFDTITNISGAASSLGQGTAITMGPGTATLSFIGSSNQSTDRPITTNTGAATLSANGTGGATIDYTGAITVGPTGDGVWITLAGSAGSAGFISNGITETGDSADATVSGGTWTHQTGTSRVGDELTVTGANTILNLDSGLFQVRDEVYVTTGANLNLNGTGVLSFNTATLASGTLRVHSGGTITFGADNPVVSTEFDGLYVGYHSTGTGTLNMGTYDQSVAEFILGNRAITTEYLGIVNGTGTLTVTGNFDLYSGTINADLASSGTNSIDKVSSGTVTLTGDNSGLGSTGSSILYGGTLILDYTTSNTTKLRAASALDMRGATLQIVGNNAAATSQSVGSLTLGSGGSSTIQVTGGTGQNAVLSLGAITRANGSQDGTIRFILPAGTQSATNGITTTTGNVNGVLGSSAFATVDDGTGTWFATNSGNNIVALASSPKDNVTTWVTGDHVTDSTGFTGGPITCTTLNSLRFDATAGSDLAISTPSALAIASGGILVTSNAGGTPSIMGGTLVSGALELIVTQDSTQPLEIGSTIRTSHALTKTGPGTLLLSGNNSYLDETEIQQGTLQAGGGNAIPDASPVTLATYEDSALELLADETIGRLAGGQRQANDDHGLVALGTHTLTINQTANAAYSGVFTGTGNIIKQGTGNLQLYGVSTGFTGIVTVDNGLVYLTGAGQINASIIRVNKGGSLMIDNLGTTRSGTRIPDTTAITMDSADGTFNASTVVRGLVIRTDQDSGLDETVGIVTAASGASYVGMEATSASDDSDIVAFDLVRLNNATLNVRGTNLGGSSSQENEFRIGDTDNRDAFIAAMIGGGGGAGTTNISIVPWMIAESYAGALADGNMGNSLATYEAASGIRPLDLTTEYAGYGTAGATLNIRESVTTDATGLPGRTLNSLVLHNANTAASTIAITGSGAGQSIINTSGAFLVTLDPSAAASSAHQFNVSGFDAGIAVGGTEYVFFVVNPSSAATTPTLTLRIDSALTSSADITKSGRGTLILTASNTAGGGTAKTTINEGTLEIADLDHIGGNTGALVFAGGTLRLGAALTDDISQRAITFLQGGGTIDTNGIDLSLASSVGSGVGGLTKGGAGNLTLGAAATCTGPTTVSAGTLTVAANNATGNGGDLTVNGGATLDVGTYGISHGLVTTSGADPVISGTGTITAASGFFFDHDGGTDLVTVDAVLAGAGGLLKANRASNLTLTGSSTFTGPVEVLQGTLTFNSIGNVGGGAGALGAPATVETGSIRMGYTTTATGLTYTGSGHSSDRIIAMQGTTGGLTITGNGTGALALGTVKGANAGAKTLTLSGSSAAGLDNSVTLIDECVATLTLTKSGANTWLLTGTNIYSGPTYVDDGTLKIGVADSLPVTTAVRVGTGTTAGTLDLNGFDQTIGALTSQSTTDTVTNYLLIDTGNTLTVNGAVTLGASAEDSTTKVIATGGGALVVNSGGANFQVGGATGSANNKTTADFSGLDSFTANLGTGVFRLGDANTDTEENPSTLRLAVNNTVTAAMIRIGDGSGGAYQHTLTLGSGANVFNADIVNVGSAGTTVRSGGAVLFDPGDTTGTLSVRASDGASRATLNMVNTSGSTSGGMVSTIDLTGHTADLLLDTLTMATRSVNTGAATATLSFDQGTLDMTTLNLASRTGAGTGNATGTLNIGGGTTTIGALIMAVNTSAGGTVAAGVNVSGGTVTIGTGTGIAINMANAGSGRTVTSTIDLTGGTVDVLGDIVRTGGAGTENATVTLAGATLDMNGNDIGDATLNVALAAESGTLINLGELNGGATLTKTTGGTLTLDGTNTYTGTTRVEAGTLVAASDAALGSSVAGTTVTGGTDTGQLLLANDVTITGETLTLEGRSTTAPGFGNQSGTNTWTGNIEFGAGGTEYTIESIAGALDVTGAISSGAVTGTVDLNLIGSGDGTVSGAISPGAGGATINLEKGGTGTWTLATANTYSGTTLITGGTLDAAADNAMGSTSGVTIQNGTLLLSGTGTDRIGNTAPVTLDYGQISAPVTETFGALTLSNSSSIDMGAGPSLLTFGDSFAQTWNGILSIYNWSGTALTGGGTDQLYFIDQGAGGFDLANQQVQFYATSDNSIPLGGPGNNVYLPSGELVPIPEPATGFGALLLAALALVAGRRRAARARP